MRYLPKLPRNAFQRLFFSRASSGYLSLVIGSADTPRQTNSSKYSVYVYVYNEYGVWSNEKPAIGAAAADEP